VPVTTGLGPKKYDNAGKALSLLRLNDLKFVDALAFGSASEEF